MKIKKMKPPTSRVLFKITTNELAKQTVELARLDEIASKLRVSPGSCQHNW